MNSKIKALSVAAALAASLGLAGCATDAGSSGGSTMPMNHGSSGPASSMMPDASAGHNPADIAFSQMMIPHHAQAVEMSDMILAKPDMPADVTALATKIKDAQAPEIDTMTGWLEDWNVPAMMSDHSGHGMTGMVDSAGMEKLKDAQGTDAVRLFLEHMIGHHEGAIDMAQQEISAGKHPESIQLARDIITAQEAEIAEMKEMLAGL
ncbi:MULTISPECIES: DUF305 domain-containing protein [Pseudarthrobacter]|uniref:DUF305 domain-containing protein n=1 Tax=Pseudarthrobacter polychromogenes TaxID=1676 RepID=A0ABQ1Y205_9MICC|nr:DUF305 domain-containing protein [Pseudarthrobacter polychromogenes]MBD1538898.1 DUF305 domain-containing protein [Arthrobacter sp. S13_S34]GGH09115.1 DUF305 domain-containing protein [Pseudarthrobacter polychromogenes]